MATLYHQVWINAPVAKVYEALATADGLGSWWAPHTSTQTDAGLVLAHSPGAAHGDVQMKVLDSTPDQRVEWESAPILNVARLLHGRVRILFLKSLKERAPDIGWE